jgi:predicted TIM-barrel fold metal-dependent hydrolase
VGTGEQAGRRPIVTCGNGVDGNWGTFLAMAAAAKSRTHGSTRDRHGDVAPSVSAPTLAAVLAFAEPSNALFGSDFPFVEMSYTTQGLRNAGLSESQLAAIERGNASRLFAARLRA